MKVYSYGNSNLITAILNSDGSYGDTYQWNGMMEFSADLSQESAKISADDDPAYITLQGPLKGTATLTLTGIANSEYAKLFPVETDSNGAILLGVDKPSIEVGISFLTDIVIDGVKSTNKVTFNKCVCKLPSEPTKSKDENGTEITSVEIEIDINPYFYDVDGVTKRVTVSKINSVDQKTIWSANKDKIYVPTGTI